MINFYNGKVCYMMEKYINLYDGYLMSNLSNHAYCKENMQGVSKN